MQLKRLAITHVRVFEQAEFVFQPGMNLVVGINGAGKSTVLDVLRIMLSRKLHEYTAARRSPIPFEDGDITVGWSALTTKLDFEVAGVLFEHLMHKPREEYGQDEPKPVFSVGLETHIVNALDAGTMTDSLRQSFESNDIILPERDRVTIQEPGKRWRVKSSSKAYFIREEDQALNVYRQSYVYQPARHVDRRTRIQRRREQQQAYSLVVRDELNPEAKSIPRDLKSSDEQPLGLYFSTRRSLPSMRAYSRQSSAGGQAAAFVDALKDNRELRLRESAEWWLVQEALADEVSDGPFAYRLGVLNDAVTSFLDDCTNLRAVREPQPTLLIDKDGVTLDVRQLSDGERGMVALVLDLAWRLAQANPGLENPLQDGKAVVLIDELDLHLHPRWQRTITQRLTTTFPNCQFIATTHSPQIIGEVSPENIILIEDGKTYRPDQSLGMDSNWILRYIMGDIERRIETLQALQAIENLIEGEQYDRATAAIDALRDEIGEDPELVGLQTRIDVIEFLSDDIDEDE